LPFLLPSEPPHAVVSKPEKDIGMEWKTLAVHALSSHHHQITEFDVTLRVNAYYVLQFPAIG